jgi:hypothetical protein
MKTDTEIRLDGTRALIEALGEVDAERYIAILMREPFDYTRWQRTILQAASVEEVSAAAMKAREGERGE